MELLLERCIVSCTGLDVMRWGPRFERRLAPRRPLSVRERERESRLLAVGL